MIEIGAEAPDFTLNDHFGRRVRLGALRERAHALLVFYPLDFTPTWSREIPGLERELARFRGVHTQVLGISVDSVHCHASWARELGGVSFPLLSDFHPKGDVAKRYGLYLESAGITDRATVLIDASGRVRHASSVGPKGERKIEDLLELCAEIDANYAGDLAPLPEAGAPPDRLRLFVRSNCGFSRAVQLAVANLHLERDCELVNVSEDPGALAELRDATGKEQAPCLLAASRPMHESQEIIRYLVDAVAPLPG